MICKICGEEAQEKFKAKILKKYDIQYFYCNNCGFLQTEEPYWMEEAYENPINISDTGYLSRNIYLSQKLTILLILFFNKKGKFLDYAGGYGVFVRLMRDIGFDFYWDDKYAKNLFALGFEYEKLIKDKKDKWRGAFEAVTTFESFEHFSDPIEEVKKMLNISGNIIFTTELLLNPLPEPDDWWYYGLDHGQHISFYSKKTFQFIANKFRLNYFNSNNLHIFTNKKFPNFALNVLKFSKFGLHKLLQKQIKSKTWEDHIQVEIKEAR